MSDYTMEQATEVIENAVGELYRGFFMLRKMNQYKEEYDQMGILLNMLMQDRDFLRKNYPVVEVAL